MPETSVELATSRQADGGTNAAARIVRDPRRAGGSYSTQDELQSAASWAHAV